MSMYLLQVSYTSTAMAALIANPQDRAKAVGAVIKKLGGKLEGLWFAFGEYDVVGLADMPDNVSAAAFSMAIGAGGACSKFTTTPLMSIADGIAAMKKAAGSGYKPMTQ